MKKKKKSFQVSDLSFYFKKLEKSKLIFNSEEGKTKVKMKINDIVLGVGTMLSFHTVSIQVHSSSSLWCLLLIKRLPVWAHLGAEPTHNLSKSFEQLLCFKQPLHLAALTSSSWFPPFITQGVHEASPCKLVSPDLYIVPLLSLHSLEGKGYLHSPYLPSRSQGNCQGQRLKPQARNPFLKHVTSEVTF